jgi:hypothetical protein
MKHPFDIESGWITEMKTIQYSESLPLPFCC